MTLEASATPKDIATIACISAMRFSALATDYDGTLATHGLVDKPTLDALRRFRRTGRRAILVTGRTMDSLRTVFPDLMEFDSIVAENGATLYSPSTNSENLLTTGPSQALVDLLRQRSAFVLEVGRAIIATSESEKQIVLHAIQELGLELQIIFNKGSLMILPSGVNKATGLSAALKALGLSIHNVVGVGDAENDHAFLAACEFSAAVANALPTVKERAQLVTEGSRSEGVAELIKEIVADDLAGHDRRLGQPVLLGRTADGKDVTVPASSINMIAGPSGGGKSTLTASFLENLNAAGYQFCVIDAEGDYELVQGAVMLGNSKQAPTVSDVMHALHQPNQNVIVNLLGLELEQRPQMFQTLFTHLQELKSKSGRPHCLIVDEVHHFIDNARASYLDAYTDDPASGLLLITVRPDRLPPEILAKVRMLVISGDDARNTLQTFCSTAKMPCPDTHSIQPQTGQVLGWRPGAPSTFAFSPAFTETRVRHRRKYAEGQLAPDRSFYFRGAQGKLNLRAHNLVTFLNIMSGVDDETWLFHLRNGEYSAWFRKEIKDEELAQQAEEIEKAPQIPADESRKKMHALITERYTLPA